MIKTKSGTLHFLVSLSIGWNLTLCTWNSSSAKEVTRLLTSKKSPVTRQWLPVSYEKILLPNNVPEGILFIRNTNGADFIYSASYFIGKQILRTRTIPTTTYVSLIKRFRSQILNSFKYRIKVSCSNQILFSSGDITDPGFKSVPKDSKEYIICLNGNRGIDSIAEIFQQWYREARALFDF